MTINIQSKYEHSWEKLGDDKIWESKEVKPLGVTVDNELKLDSHIANICFKANLKLSLFGRLARLLTFDKKQILFRTFLESQFKYCPLTWTFVTEGPIIELITSMNEAYDLCIIPTNSRSRTYSQKMVHYCPSYKY